MEFVSDSRRKQKITSEVEEGGADGWNGEEEAAARQEESEPELQRETDGGRGDE